MKIFTQVLFNFINKRYNDHFTEFCKENDITQVEVDILAFLTNNPAYKHAQDIIDVRGISKAHASAAVDKLVKKGYLTREADPKCRRCNILKVNDSASKLVKEILAIQKKYNDRTYNDISKEDLEVYNKVLSKMTENLGGKVYECKARK